MRLSLTCQLPDKNRRVRPRGGGAAQAARREERRHWVAWPAWAPAHDVVRVLFACILLAAALLKTHQIATHLPTQLGLHGPVWLKILLVDLELLLGLWFLSNVFPLWVHRSALGLAMLFATIALYRLLAGEASCGCFGEVTVHPGWTLAMDTLIAACLWRSWPASADGSTSNPHTCATIVTRLSLAFSIFLLVTTPASIWMMGRSLSALGLVGSREVMARAVVLDPQDWVGRRCPLLDLAHFAEESRMAEGKWVFIVYDRSCHQCDRFIAEHEQRWFARDPSNPMASVALIDVSPEPEHETLKWRHRFAHGRLRQHVVWGASVPVELHLQDGVVVGARSPQ